MWPFLALFLPYSVETKKEGHLSQDGHAGQAINRETMNLGIPSLSCHETQKFMIQVSQFAVILIAY